MNNEVRRFVEKHLEKLNGEVLEVGSMDENGCVRDLVPHAIGTDMREGRNVDIVCSAEDLLKCFGAERFDAVMTLDAFEHMENWRGAIRGMWDVLKPEGWLVFSMAQPAKGRHGYPNDYWRADWERVLQIFPQADEMWTSGPSMGWVVQKKGPLPDLSKINLIPI